MLFIHWTRSFLVQSMNFHSLHRDFPMHPVEQGIHWLIQWFFIQSVYYSIVLMKTPQHWCTPAPCTVKSFAFLVPPQTNRRLDWDAFPELAELPKLAQLLGSLVDRHTHTDGTYSITRPLLREVKHIWTGWLVHSLCLSTEDCLLSSLKERC